MTKMILIYASMGGNTEMMAEEVANGVRQEGEDLEVIDIMDGIEASELENYDGILLGSYTWGDGELPDDFLDFYDEMESINLTGKKAAVFGSCDSAYPNFGAAVDILMDKLSERGDEVYPQGLKVEIHRIKKMKKPAERLERNLFVFKNTNSLKEREDNK